MVSLLEKTRMINELLQQENALRVNSDLPYNHMAATLGDILESNTYIIDNTGMVIGYVVEHDINNTRIKDMLTHQQFPSAYVRQALSIVQTKENIDIADELTAFPVELREELTNTYTTVVPIFGAGERLGTIILGRIGKAFNQDDLVLAEYSATVVGMQVLHQKNQTVEREIRDQTMVQMAVNTLSYSELKAVKAIFDALDGDEGRLTASSIADQIGITRSVIVNALRKLESAGIIESRSLGMKGTYLKIINGLFKDELAKR